MRLHRDSNPALNTVTAYGQDYIEINRVAYSHAVYFGPEGDIHAWNVHSSAEITAHELQRITGLDAAAAADPMALLDDLPPKKPDDAPEVVLIGTGVSQHFLPVAVTTPLLRAGIGVEVMSTQAAARTYNILMAEGRRVLAALLPHEESE
ncbi:MAG TPA: Mth938-like domain-containing protein [Burkholderiaceae bacterium]|nr:Mth938-like domain-containing protein [Burkholderiaceae bacterium]